MTKENLITPCEGGYKIKNTKEDYLITGREYWQTISGINNEYKDKVFKTKKQCVDFLKRWL